MELEQLHQLDAIDRYGTISAAAEGLHLTQPSLSRSIKRLEADLGHELFERTRNKVTFNEAGRLALEHARAILADERRMRDAFDELSRRRRTLEVGSVAPAPSWRLTALVVERFPGTILDPEIMTVVQVESALINRSIDLAITLRPIQLPNVSSVRLMTEDLYFNAPAGHALVGNSTVSFADLDGEAFLVFEQIGFWMDVCRRNLPNSQLIVQKDYNVFLQLANSTDLCSFATDAPEHIVDDDTRVRIPIVDADAHATFFLCALSDAPERVSQILDWVRAPLVTTQKKWSPV